MKSVKFILAAAILTLCALICASCGVAGPLNAKTLSKLKAKDGYNYLMWDDDVDACKIADNKMSVYRLNYKTDYQTLNYNTESDYEFTIIDENTFRIESIWKGGQVFSLAYTSKQKDCAIFLDDSDPEDIEEAMCFMSEELKNNIIAWRTSEESPEPIWDTSLTGLEERIALFDAFRDHEPKAKTTKQTTQATTDAPTLPTPTAAPTTQAAATAATTGLSVTSAQLTVPADTPPQYYTVTTKESDLNIRSAPNTNAPVIGKIPKGATVAAYGSEGPAQQWAYIQYNGVIGWVSLAYLSPM